MKKLFVGSLPYSTTSNELQDLFAQYGQLGSVNVVIDRFSGKSKGFGFVEMLNVDDASTAIQALHGRDFQGRNLVVSEAKEKAERSRQERPRW